MTDENDLLKRVAARAHEQRALALPAPLAAEDIAAAEEWLGFRLPPLLRRLYGEVANGGFGPDYLLFPLTGDGRTALSAYQAEYGHDHARRQSAHWPRGVLPILDWGCAMNAAVDCLSPGGPVLLFEPNAEPDDWADAWFQDAPSLAAWLDAWLSGTGWWEEDVMMGENPVEPTPWPEAAQRLGKVGGVSGR